jgi:Flp pilus assembly protein TadB
MLKIFEVVILLGAGVCFVVWQFRDLRRAKEITRQQDEAQKNKAMHANSGSGESPAERDPYGH